MIARSFPPLMSRVCIRGNYEFAQYRGKALFADYGLRFNWLAVDSAGAAIKAAQDIGGERWVVKAQVQRAVEGRPGRKLVDSPDAGAICRAVAGRASGDLSNRRFRAACATHPCRVLYRYCRRALPGRRRRSRVTAYRFHGLY